MFDWKNLKNKLCPRCSYMLRINSQAFGFVCENPNCHFTIGVESYNRIVDEVNRGENRAKLEGFGFE